MVRDVSATTGVLVLPTLPYGCSLGHSRRWPGTIALDPILVTQLVTQIGTWAYFSGVRRLFLVNAHVTNAAPLRCALETLRATYDDLMIAHIDTSLRVTSHDLPLAPPMGALLWADGLQTGSNPISSG